MKRLITIAILIALSLVTFAQQTIGFQTVVRKSSGDLVRDKQIAVRTSIILGDVNGESIYTETHNPWTNTNGTVSLNIGTGVTEDDFSQIDWSQAPCYIKVEIDTDGGENYKVLSVNQILAVPHAFYAEKAGNVPDVSGFITEENDPTVPDWAMSDTKPAYDYSELANTPEMPTIPTNISAFDNDAQYITMDEVPAQVNADWNATDGVEQILDKPTQISAFTNDGVYITTYTESQTIANAAALGNSVNTQLKDVANPTDAQDAVNKSYLDSIAERYNSIIAAHNKKIDDLPLLLNGFVDERDGTHYKVIKLGDQIWMAENLKYAGDIPLGGINDYSDTLPYRYYPNGQADNVETYGYLYNWTASMNGESSSDAEPSGVQGVCPAGWHLPGDREWSTLTSSTCGYYNAAAILSGNKNLWGSVTLTESEYFGTSGFNILPAGCYWTFYMDFGSSNRLWSSTEDTATGAYNVNVSSDATNISNEITMKYCGFSVRCIKD